VTALFLSALLASARADEPPPHPPNLGYDNLFAVQLDPLGVADDFRLRYRIGLYASPRPVLAQHFAGIVTPLFVSPSLIRPGIGVEVPPLSVLHLYVGYEPTLYFGAVGALHSYASPNANVGFGPVQLGGPPSMPGDLYATVVHQVVLGLTVQFATRWL